MNRDSTPEAPTSLSLVVGLAFNDADGPAFDQAVRVAQRVPRSELHLVHVFEKEPSLERTGAIVAHLRLYVNEKAALLGGLNSLRVGIHVRTGKPVRELAQFATDVHADLIVLGSTRGPHVKSWLVGSTAEHLMGSAPCPVFVAAPRAKDVAPHEPSIEPPCPDCVRARESSGGATWWCERHSHHARHHAHTFSYQREIPLAMHDSEVIPTGIRF